MLAVKASCQKRTAGPPTKEKEERDRQVCKRRAVVLEQRRRGNNCNVWGPGTKSPARKHLAEAQTLLCPTPEDGAAAGRRLTEHQRNVWDFSPFYNNNFMKEVVSAEEVPVPVKAWVRTLVDRGGQELGPKKRNVLAAVETGVHLLLARSNAHPPPPSVLQNKVSWTRSTDHDAQKPRAIVSIRDRHAEFLRRDRSRRHFRRNSRVQNLMHEDSFKHQNIAAATHTY